MYDDHEMTLTLSSYLVIFTNIAYAPVSVYSTQLNGLLPNWARAAQVNTEWHRFDIKHAGRLIRNAVGCTIPVCVMCVQSYAFPLM